MEKIIPLFFFLSACASGNMIMGIWKRLASGSKNYENILVSFKNNLILWQR